MTVISSFSKLDIELRVLILLFIILLLCELIKGTILKWVKQKQQDDHK
jgi:hypothetical protein